MKIALALASSLVLLAVSAPVQAAGDAAKGKTLYAKCQACHGADGKGTPAMQKKYGDAWKAHGSPEVQAMTDEQLQQAFRNAAIHKGIGASVSDADLADLVAYIRTLKE